MEVFTMKVADSSHTNISLNASSNKKLTPEEVKKKIQEKFGTAILEKKKSKLPQDKVELKNRDKLEDKTQAPSGDVGKNDPNDTVTQDKIRNVLKSGAFNFNEQERAALAKILK